MHSIEEAPLQLSAAHLTLLLDVLKTQVPAAQVWAYGSRVSGGAHEASDLDLVVRNAHDLTASCEKLQDLREALQESALPILVDVHDWAALPAAFQRNIEREYVQLQAGT